MMFGSPFFADYDDEYEYIQPRSYEQQRRRAIAREEARRRAESERYYRMKEIEEEERLRRQLEYERRRRQREILEERHRQQQELEAEQSYRNELFRQRAARAQAERFLNGDDSDPDTSESSESESDEAEYDTEPVYQLVRGPGGGIYRMKIGVKQVPTKSKHSPPRNKRQESEKENTRPSSKKESRFFSRSVDKALPEVVASAENKMKSKRSTRKKTNSTGKKKRIRVIVEDASDSETQDEFYNSPWRNRRPPPGEWMEPVQGFEDMHLS